MANRYLATNLIASLKRRGMLPTTTDGLKDSDYLAIMSEELQSYISVILLGVTEEYHIQNYDLTVVANTAIYDIPPRAAGNALRAVQIKDTGTQFRPLYRIEPEREYWHPSNGSVIGYKLEDESIVLIPTPSSSGATLRLKYFARPNVCVDSASGGEIASFNAGAQTVTLVNAPPASFTTAVKYDFIKGLPAFKSRAIDQVVTNIAGSVLTFSAVLPTDLAIGDYVNLAYESCIPQCPVELHPLLAQRVAFKTLEAQNQPGAMASKAVCDEMKKDVLTLLTPRVKGSARVIINPWGPGWRQTRYRR